MAKLARIKDVSLYVGLTEDALACFEMKAFLEANAIPYTLLAYMDDSQHEPNFQALSSWVWGPDGEKRAFTKFPILTWREFDEDFNEVQECALAPDEARTKLLPHVALIKT
jgi:hypothetical protein